MTRQIVRVGLLLCLIQGGALAEAPNSNIANFDPAVSTPPMDMLEGRGVKIGEGTTLHPVFGLQTGLASNVFFEEADTNAAGVLRLIGQVGAGSLSGLRLTPAEAIEGGNPQGKFEYRAELRVAYDLLLSTNDAVQETGGLGIGATLRGMTNPLGPWSFGFNENFLRLVRAANFETDANTNRDLNTLSLNLLYHPQGRTLALNTYYNNTVDVFERSEQDFANRWAHRIGVRPMWRWLPLTVVYADLSWGITTGLGSSSKVTSYPLSTVAGVSTLFTPKLALNLQAGYGNGFYSAGPSYSSVTIGSEVQYKYSPLGHVSLGYSLVYTDSVNANYYRDHVIALNLEQLFPPLVFVAQPEVHLREYAGTIVMGTAGQTTRDDFIFSLITGLHYLYRNNLAITLDYHFSTVQTGFTYMVDGVVDDPGFTRHELLAGARWAL